MANSVSEVAAFVFKNGALAEQVLFSDDEIPGLTPEEQKAIERVESHLEETWVTLLTMCREALWKLSEGHSCHDTTRISKNRPSTMWNNDCVQVPLVIRSSWEATCGFSLEVWEGRTSYRLYSWCWTAAKHRETARDAVQGMNEVQWSGKSHWVDLGTPQESETYEVIGERAAKVLWNFAKPIAEAVLASERGET